MVFFFTAVFVLTTANVALTSSVQGDGNACFDMAAAIPGLQNLTGNHLVSISTNRLIQLFDDFYASSFPHESLDHLCHSTFVIYCYLLGSLIQCFG